MSPPGSPGPGYRVEAPDLLSRPGIERGQEPSYPVFAARRPDDDLVLHDERSQRQAVARLGTRQRNIPDETSALRVDGHEMAVDRPHEQRVAENREAAVHAAAAQPRQRRRLMRVHPEDPPGRRVDRDDVVGRLDGVHDAVHDEGSRFELLQRASLEDPPGLEIADVLRGDLRERAVPMTRVASRVGQPVVRFCSGAQQTIVRHLRVHRRTQQDHYRQNALHHGLLALVPLSVTR